MGNKRRSPPHKCNYNSTTPPIPTSRFPKSQINNHNCNHAVRAVSTAHANVYAHIFILLGTVKNERLVPVVVVEVEVVVARSATEATVGRPTTAK